ncbi:hypothetical protein RRG08_020002 [Elysia crispata]|uniref:Uncharacterized protein n=1 Tax=Elysia crispata TaxID=231223 RepID=A0AAE1BCB0_9GAST|nr:hypothetical protein RRG08_020002 [Elysia crispata]
MEYLVLEMFDCGTRDWPIPHSQMIVSPHQGQSGLLATWATGAMTRIPISEIAGFMVLFEVKLETSEGVHALLSSIERQ